MMPDREKVIKWLECCQYSSKAHCDGCPYVYDGLCSTNACTADLASDAIALFKKQEAVEPRRIDGKRNHFIRCGHCSCDLLTGFLFCPHCGREVKWDD